MPDINNGVIGMSPSTMDPRKKIFPVFECKILKQKRIYYAKIQTFWGLLPNQLIFFDLRLLFNWNLGVYIPVLLVWHFWSIQFNVFLYYDEVFNERESETAGIVTSHRMPSFVHCHFFYFSLLLNIMQATNISNMHPRLRKKSILKDIEWWNLTDLLSKASINL